MSKNLKQRFKRYKVHKHCAYGRTYNSTNGEGYDHYTKGHRKSSMTAEIMDKGSKFLFALLERAFPKKVEESVVKES